MDATCGMITALDPDQLIINFQRDTAPLMATMVLRKAPAHVDKDDLVSVGMLAIVEAKPKIDVTRDPMEVIAYLRTVAHGAMRREASKGFRDKFSEPTEDFNGSSGDTAESQLIEKERLERAEAALVAMPVEAAILRARFGDGERGKVTTTTYRREAAALNAVQKRAVAA